MNKIAITTGDKLGIGKELVKKALDILRPAKNRVVIVGEKIDVDYDFIPVDILDNGEFCYQSLKKVSELALNNEIQGIVTSPVSKKVLNDAGYYYSGQTEVLEHLLSPNEKRAQMLFIADELKVMLLTRHVALNDIKLNKDEIIFQTKILNDFLIDKYKIKSPKIALCALNPHAGEGGILGNDEIKILNPAVIELQNEGINITEAKSADALFAKVGREYLSKEKLSYDCILACYHDQGLCPLKALAFNKAVNTTIGLRVIRTSPSSGTAYDIAGKNIANPDSMVEALKLALKLA